MKTSVVVLTTLTALTSSLALPFNVETAERRAVSSVPLSLAQAQANLAKDNVSLQEAELTQARKKLQTDERATLGGNVNAGKNLGKDASALQKERNDVDKAKTAATNVQKTLAASKARRELEYILRRAPPSLAQAKANVAKDNVAVQQAELTQAKKKLQTDEKATLGGNVNAGKNLRKDASALQKERNDVDKAKTAATNARKTLAASKAKRELFYLDLEELD